MKAGTAFNNLSSNENQIRIIPAVSFGCNGTITKAVFAAEASATPYRPISNAELQLWYAGTASLPWFYSRRSKASLEDAAMTSTLNVYEKLFSEPLRFMAGDVLGLYLPADGYSPLNLFFLTGYVVSSMPSYSFQQSNLLTFFNSNNPLVERDFDVPLLSIEIGKHLCTIQDIIYYPHLLLG